MGTILSIIAIVLLVSLYDYFSARRWQRVTSSVRNDIVFEKRNRQYGAFVIRRDYDKRIVLILGGMILSVGAAYAAFITVRTLPETHLKVPVGETIATVIDFTDDKPEKVEIPQQKATAPTAPQETWKFREPTVTDIPVDDQVAIIDDTKNYGSDDIKDPGDDDDFTISGPPSKGGGTGITDVVVNKDPVDWADLDELAQFPGGKEAMARFLQKNFVYPAGPLNMGIGGKCYLQFVVSKNGEISRVEILRGVPDCPECDAEARRVIRKMPPWKPGKKNGKEVDSYFNMPINFEPAE